MDVTEDKIIKGDLLDNALDGYNFVFNSSSSTHGGAGIFISDDLRYKVRADLDVTTEDLCESIFIEINISKNENLLLGCLYRHPNNSINVFTEDILEPMLDKIKRENMQCILMGDFNIDLLRSNTNNAIGLFYQTMCHLILHLIFCNLLE